MRKSVLFLMVLACVAMWPGGGAMSADFTIGGPFKAEGPMGTTLTCDDMIPDSEKSLVLAHIAKYPATGGRNSPPIVFGSSQTVSSLTENTVFCGMLAYDIDLDDHVGFVIKKRPVKGELDLHPSSYEYSPYGLDYDRICRVKKINNTDVLTCHGKIRYRPNSDPEKGPVFDGTDSFSYYAYEIENKSNIATVIITYKPGKSPVSKDDYVEATVGIPIVIDVLANDTDPEGGKLAIDSVDTSFNAGGIAVINADNTITYTPQHRFPHIEITEAYNAEFKYMVVNDVGLSSTSAVKVSVVLQPGPPPPPPLPWWKRIFSSGSESSTDR